MSVRKRIYPDGTVVWIADLKDENNKRTTKTFALKKSADAFHSKTRQQIQDGTFVADGNSITVGRLIDTWLENIKKRAENKAGMSFSCLQSYEDAIQRARGYFDALVITKLTHDHIQKVADDLVAKGYAGATVRHTIRAMRQMLGYAIEKKWLRINPVTDGKLILPPARKVLKIPSKDDIRHLLRVACERQPREREHALRVRIALAALGLFSGLRRGEMVALTWEAVDFKRSTIRVRASLSRLDGLKGPKTDAGIREAPMARPVEEALRGLLDYYGGSATGPVLRTATGKRIAGEHLYNQFWSRLIRKAGLITPDGKALYRLHDLRHTAVSLLIDQGLSALHIKTAIGHASVKTTLDVYGHLFPNDAAIQLASDKAADALSATTMRLAPPPSKIRQISQ